MSAPAAAVLSAPAARTAAAQSVVVALGWQVADGVLVLTATTPRRGASHTDSWSMSPSLALALTTVAATSHQDPANYVSRASVAHCSLAHDTTYTFSYSIVMRTSECAWVGGDSVAVTVGPDGSLTTPDGRARNASG